MLKLRPANRAREELVGFLGNGTGAPAWGTRRLTPARHATWMSPRLSP
jgi:hypothetical protein